MGFSGFHKRRDGDQNRYGSVAGPFGFGVPIHLR